MSTAAVLELYDQREATPETAPLIRRLAPSNRFLLPHWHIDDCGWQNRHRGVHHRVPAGAYAQIPAWSGREHWLMVDMPAVLARSHAELAEAGVSVRTFTRWAEVETMYCGDERTGRRCVVKPITVAKVAGLGKSTVQKCRALAEKLGLRVVVFRGRMLNVQEKFQAWKAGSRQRGLSSEAAFTVPKSVDNQPADPPTETPTRGMGPSSEKSPSSGLTYRAASDERTETATPLRPKRRRAPRDRRASTVARDLQAQVPWLGGCTLSEIIPSVHKCATNALMPWTAYDVITHMNAVNQRLGYTSLTPTFIRTSPAAVLAWYLRGVDAQADHPRMGAFLSGTALELRAPWCGTCDQVTRHVQVGELLGRCPRCHPLAGEHGW